MARQEARALTPRLRFPEFREAAAWEEKALLNAAQCVTQGGTPDTSVPEYWNGEIAWITPAEMGKSDDPHVGSTVRRITEEGLQSCSSELLPVRSVVISTRAPIGHLAINTVPMAINQGCKGIVPGAGLDHRFLFASLLLAKPRLMDLGAGNTFKELSASALKSFKIALPARAEQQKIADCLTSLDEVIAAQGRKVEALKAHKRGLMQQLFPREGETRPRLRFPEFRNAPEWKEEPLGDLVDLLSGYPFKGEDIVDDSSGERLMRGINITEGAIRHSSDIDRYYLGSLEGLEKFRLEANDLVIGMDGSKVGKNSALIEDVDAGALLVQRVARLRTASASLMKFIFHQVHSPRFHSYVDRINTSSGIPHISAKQIREYPIHSTIGQEQQCIADSLSTLDTQITSETARLAALKNHKQGLMQQLFPAPEGM